MYDICMAVEYTLFIFVLITSLFCDDDTHISKGPAINNGGGGGRGGGKGGGFNYFCLNWERPQTEKYVTRGDPNF
jgi:hypothetical protein